MPTKRVNRQSRRIDVRVPLELVSEIDRYEKADQSYSSFVLTALRNEVERRKKMLLHSVLLGGKQSVLRWGRQSVLTDCSF